MKVRDETYQYYFYFTQERMKIFWRRYKGSESNLIDDPISAYTIPRVREAPVTQQVDIFRPQIDA
jgi:hypothetical protein